MSLSKSHHFKSWFSKHWLYSHNVFFIIIIIVTVLKNKTNVLLLMRFCHPAHPYLCVSYVFLLPRPSSHMIKSENSASMYRLASDSEKWACSLRLLVAFLALSMLLLYATEDAHLVMPTLPTSICAQQRELASKIKTESKTCYLTVTNYL